MNWILAALLCAVALPASAAPASIRVVELTGTLKSGDRTVAKGDVVDGAATVTLADGGTALLALPQGLIRLTGPASFTADRDSFSLTSGYALSGLRKLKRRWSFKTPAAVAAVRGTVFYVEVQPKNTYLCLCEGALTVNAAGPAHEAFKFATKTHQAYSFDADAGRLGSTLKPAHEHEDAEIEALKKRL